LEGVPERVQARVRRPRVARDGLSRAGRVVLGAPELAARASQLRDAVDRHAGRLGAPALPLDRPGAEIGRRPRLGLPAVPLPIRALHLARARGPPLRLHPPPPSPPLLFSPP